MSRAPIGQRPSGGDIVSCWFPDEAEPIQPGRKLRPCIVVTMESDINGEFARVAYGSGQGTPDKNTGRNLGAHYVSVEPQGLLAIQTTFNMAKVVRLPFTNQWFAPWPNAPTILLCKLRDADLEAARIARDAGEPLATARSQSKPQAEPIVTRRPARHSVHVPPRAATPNPRR